MRPIRTENSNHNWGPPPGQEGVIGNLPCEFPVESDIGSVFTYAVYEPSQEERQLIAEGYNIRLGVGWIGGFPPVSLGVVHEPEKVG